MTDCNCKNDKFDTSEWARIESQCVKQKHLGPSESLEALIAQDEQTLANAGITFDQLDKFFTAFKLHWKKYSNEKTELDDELQAKVAHFYSSSQFEKLNKIGWCCWGRTRAKFNMFGTNYFVEKYTWGGAETCPFQSTQNKKYYGYDYGSHDWVIFNLDSNIQMHIGDLLFHQIIAHKFFQSESSPYRVEPTKLVQLFNLKPNQDYTIQKVQVKYATDAHSTSAFSMLGLKREDFTILAENSSWRISKNNSKYLLDVFVDNIIEPIVFDKINFGRKFKGFHAFPLDGCITADELA